MSNQTFNHWDRIERFLGHEALMQLAGKSVAILGLGSGGGMVAVTLAMSGVGRFLLIDDDIIETTNIVRHVADLRYVGKPKVQAVADLIHQRNPKAQIEAVVGRLEDHIDRLDGVDLVIAGVDGERAKFTINEACRERRLTAVYAGVYERGEGGDAVVIHVDDGPCYACWADRLRENVSDPQTGAPDEPELDYGMIGPDGTIAAEPGLWLHVVRIATVQADLALNELLIGQPIHRTYPANTVILANVEMEIFNGVKTQPYGAVWVNVERNPQCLVCGTKRKLQADTGLSLDELMSGRKTSSSDEK